jgi:hypothetical protein
MKEGCYMFNFSANNLVLISQKQYDKANVFILKDRTTNRCYKIYDFLKTASFESSKLYCVFGKVNSSDKLYLVLDGMKEDKKNVC